MAQNLADVVADFAILPDWESRYGYLIELARQLPPYPAELRDDAHLVRGCTSQVWLHAGWDADHRLTLALDSDALLVRGLLALVFIAYAGQTAAFIVALDLPTALAPSGLLQNLTPNRRNGFASVIQRLQQL